MADNDYVLIVPPGTRIRYVESAHAEHIYLVSASSLQPKLIADVWFPEWRTTELSGLPIFDAERFS